MQAESCNEPWPAHWIKLQRDTPMETWLSFAALAGLFLVLVFSLDILLAVFAIPFLSR